MEVAREKRVAPSLLDVVAPRPAAEPTGGRSFHDCLRPEPVHAPQSTREQERKGAAEPTGASSARERPLRSDEPVEVSKPKQKASGDEASSVDEVADIDDVENLADEQQSEAADAVAAAGAVITPAPVPQPEALVAKPEVAAGEMSEVGASGTQGVANAAVLAVISEPGSPGEGLPAEAAEPASASLLEETHPASIAAASEAATVPTDQSTNKSGRAKARAVSAPTAVAGNIEGIKASDVERPIDSQGKISLPSDLELVDETAATGDDQQLLADTQTPVVPDQTTTPAVAAEVLDAAALKSVGENAAAGPATPSTAPVVDPGSSPKPPLSLLRTRGAQDESPTAASDIDPARFLNRVVKAFQSAHQRDSEVRLRLHPAELGALSIEVRIHEGVLSARVQAETPEAQAVLMENLPQLRERLAEQGIRIDQFDVDLRDHSDRSGREAWGDPQREESSRRSAANTSSPQRPRGEIEVSGGPVRSGPAGGLNVVV